MTNGRGTPSDLYGVKADALVRPVAGYAVPAGRSTDPWHPMRTGAGSGGAFLVPPARLLIVPTMPHPAIPETCLPGEGALLQCCVHGSGSWLDRVGAERGKPVAYVGHQWPRSRPHGSPRAGTRIRLSSS